MPHPFPYCAFVTRATRHPTDELKRLVLSPQHGAVKNLCPLPSCLPCALPFESNLSFWLLLLFFFFLFDAFGLLDLVKKCSDHRILRILSIHELINATAAVDVTMEIIGHLNPFEANFGGNKTVEAKVDGRKIGETFSCGPRSRDFNRSFFICRTSLADFEVGIDYSCPDCY